MAYNFGPLDDHIKETEEWLVRELSGIRTGRAAPALIDAVKPEAYGVRTPITQIASVTIEDARTLRIVPWDKTLCKPIEKALSDADLGVSVSVDDIGVRVSFPELTAERRALLLKVAHEKLEQAKVTLRGHRAHAIKEIEAAEKEGGMGKDDVARFKDEVQKRVDTGSDTLEALSKRKHEDIAH